MTDRSCRNCDAVLVGRWCHACGQDSRDPIRERQQLVAELVDSMFGADSRLARSLRLLVGSPGAMTLEFVAGRRVRYIGPVRLYFIASLLFFATYTLVIDPVLVTIVGLGDPYAGLARIDLAQRWLPTMMIAVWPLLAAVLQLLFRNTGRPFLATLVFVLHFGAFAFLCIPLGHLVAFGLGAIGAGKLGLLVVYAAHGANAVNLYLGARRFYGQPHPATALRLLAFGAAMTLVLGGGATSIALLVERSG